jgi:hypothetical protein
MSFRFGHQRAKNNNDDSLENAGNYIGSRTPICFFFILTAFPNPFFIGHKSIFRFGDLKEARTEN